MCLILHKMEDDAEVHPYIIETAFDRNSDGLGFMYPSNGSLVVRRFMPENLAEVQELWEAHSKKPNMTAHFRLATKGAIDRSNLHPFKIFNNRKDGLDLYMMHNGTLHFLDAQSTSEGGKSDTQLMVELLKPFFTTYGANVLKEPLFQEMLKLKIGNNKLVFQFGDGDTVIINEQAGTKTVAEGFWLSNTYAYKTPAQQQQRSGYWNTWENYTREAEATNVSPLNPNRGLVNTKPEDRETTEYIDENGVLVPIKKDDAKDQELVDKICSTNLGWRYDPKRPGHRVWSMEDYESDKALLEANKSRGESEEDEDRQQFIADQSVLGLETSKDEDEEEAGGNLQDSTFCNVVSPFIRSTQWWDGWACYGNLSVEYWMDIDDTQLLAEIVRDPEAAADLLRDLMRVAEPDQIEEFFTLEGLREWEREVEAHEMEGDPLNED